MPRVSPRGARLAAEARRERAVADRELVEDLVEVHADQRDLGGADEVEPVLGHRVVVALVGREEAGAVHRLLAHEHRRDHRREPFGDEPLECKSVEREREQRRVAGEETEARTGELGRALELEAADLGVLARVHKQRRLTPALDLDGVVLGHAVRRGLVRRVRNFRERLLALRLGGRELRLERAQPLLDLLQLLELLGRRLAVELLPRPQLVDLRDEGAPALVRSEQRVERLGGAAARKGSAERVRVRTGFTQVDHRAKNASSTCATPSSSTGGQTKSASSLTRSCAFATATP